MILTDEEHRIARALHNARKQSDRESLLWLVAVALVVGAALLLHAVAP